MEGKKGYTLFEKWTGRAVPPRAPKPENSIGNLLKLHCGDYICARVLEEDDRPFTVTEVREYRRSIAQQDYRFTDYLLERGDQVRILRANPRARAGALPQDCDLLWLKIFYEMEFDQNVRNAVTQKVFEVDNNDDGTPDAFYDALSAGQEGFLADIRAARSGNPQISSRKLRYWDFYRKGDPKQGERAEEDIFFFVEIDEGDGYTTMLEGAKISGGDIEIYPAGETG